MILFTFLNISSNKKLKVEFKKLGKKTPSVSF